VKCDLPQVSKVRWTMFREDILGVLAGWNQRRMPECSQGHLEARRERAADLLLGVTVAGNELAAAVRTTLDVAPAMVIATA
jgi:hypothetical protein